MSQTWAKSLLKWLELVILFAQNRYRKILTVSHNFHSHFTAKTWASIQQSKLSEI